jgi:hypothetical protein
MTLDDLRTVCPECAGKPRAAKRGSSAKGAKILRYRAPNCRRCANRGWLPTEAGQAILQFLMLAGWRPG